MDNKRGAIELSITTIVIVVIGVTLLVLGLVFVRGVFSDLEEYRGSISQSVNNELNTLFDEKLDDFFFSKTKVTIERGTTLSVGIGYRNSDTVSSSCYYELDSADNNIELDEQNTRGQPSTQIRVLNGEGSSRQTTLQPGDKRKDEILISVGKGVVPGTYSIEGNIKCAAATVDSSPRRLFIEVISG